MIYYLTDLNTMVTKDNSTQFPDQLVMSYAKEFSVLTQLTSFAQGLWHLDHGNVEVEEVQTVSHIIFSFTSGGTQEINAPSDC